MIEKRGIITQAIKRFYSIEHQWEITGRHCDLLRAFEDQSQISTMDRPELESTMREFEAMGLVTQYKGQVYRLTEHGSSALKILDKTK